MSAARSGSPTALLRGRAPRDREERDRTERALLIRYHRDGDLRARADLVERFLPLARDLALRYTYTDEPFDDLMQVAEPRAHQGRRPLRAPANSGTRFTELRGPHHPGRAQAPLPRQGLGPARAAATCRSVRSRSVATPRSWPRSSAARPTYARWPGRSAAGRVRARGKRGGRQLRGIVAWMRRRREATRSRPRSSSCWATTTLPTGWSRAGMQSRARGSRCPRSSGTLLALRFMDNLTQREIGKRIGYSQMHVSRLLRRALASLEERGGGLGPAAEPPLQRTSVGDGKALPVVVEVDEHLGAGAATGRCGGPTPRSRVPSSCLAGPVAVVQAYQGPRGGQLAGLKGPAGVIADDQRGVVFAQQPVHRRREPALVTELEAVAAGGQAGEGVRQDLVIALEVGGYCQPPGRACLRSRAARCARSSAHPFAD